MIKLEGSLANVDKDITNITERISESAIDRFCEKLAEYGVIAAQEAYAVATPSYDDVPHVEYSDRTITASGEDLLFVEFGTGIFQSKQHEKAAEFGFGPTTFSAEHGQWLTDPKKMKRAEKAGHPGEFPIGKGKGHWTKGNDPAEGMTKAMDAMRAKIREAWNDRH